MHLPVVVDDLAGALDLARTLARVLASMPQVDVGGTTVSAEDTQDVRHWVFCDRLMAVAYARPTTPEPACPAMIPRLGS
ncbi:hypothetical protein AB0B85_33270 [Micromonospora sp. NPDC049044]|uniref:hypothetical protein n=1 Tax=unclassified Micromonospora TaxID=2617518 RepID=UPI0033FC3BDB